MSLLANQGPLLRSETSRSNHSLYSSRSDKSISPPGRDAVSLASPQSMHIKVTGAKNKQAERQPALQPESTSQPQPKLPQIKKEVLDKSNISTTFAKDAKQRYNLFNQSLQPPNAVKNTSDLEMVKKWKQRYEGEKEKQSRLHQGEKSLHNSALTVPQEQKSFKYLIRHFHKHNSIMAQALNRFWQIFEQINQYLQLSPYQLSLFDSLEAIKLKMEGYLQSRIHLNNLPTVKPSPDWTQEQFISYYGKYKRVYLQLEDSSQVHQAFTLKKYKNCVFFGHMNQNKKEEGILHYFNGKCFEGFFKEDQKEFGLEIDEEEMYIGSFKKGFRHGEGILKTSEMLSVGTFTQGQFSTSSTEEPTSSSLFEKVSGLETNMSSEYKKGFIISHSAVIVYDRGTAVMRSNVGDLFVGSLGFEGEKRGEGLQLFANGDIYVGKYEGGNPQGYGQYYWQNGSHYRGQFLSGMRHGRGIWQMVNGDCYEGQYMNDKKNGKGIYLWKNGSRYEGNFQNDYRHGYGEMKWQDGRVYKGKWLNGIQKNLLITLEKPQVKSQAKSQSKSVSYGRPSFRSIQVSNNKKIPLDKLKSLYNPSYH